MNKNEIESIKSQLIISKKSRSKSKVIRFVIIILAVGYTIMPVDMIPDAVPFIGTVDDIGIWLLNIQSYLKEIKKNKELITNILGQLDELLE